MNNANLGVPILGAAFTDSWETNQHSVTRFLNAPVTLPNATGTGKDHIQAPSIHYYDYAFNPESLLDHVDGYQAKLANAGKSGMPIWATESGAEAGGKFLPNDARAPVNIQRWVLMAAAKRLKSMVLYGHFAGIESVHYLGDPLNNASTIQSLTQAFAIGGTKICNAAVLNDGRVWVHTLTGNQFLR